MLTQNDIDRLDPPQKESWFDGTPGLILTILVLAAFVAGFLAMIGIWNLRG